MRSVKVVRLCLVATTAMSALVVGSASAAAPEFGRCLKAPKVEEKYTGAFENSGCTKTSATHTGKFEWHPGAVKVKQTTSGGEAVLGTVGGLGVRCASEMSVGEYSGTKEVKNIVVTFKGCVSGGASCNTPGAKLGELVTKPLEGSVGIIKRGLNTKKEEVPLKNQLGFDLFPEGKTGLFIEFACVGLTVAVRGSVIVPIKSNKMALTTELKFVAEKGKQKPEAFEGEAKDILESSFREGPFEQSGQTETTILTNEEKLELNSVV